ncbi:hypothetical protein Tco_0384286, partial [Tanacetum coccineum]
NTLSLLTQSYKSHLPQTNNQLRASSNARNKAMIQDGKVVVQDIRGRYSGTNQGRTFNQGRPFQKNNVGAQNRGGMINPGQAKPIKLLQGQDATNASSGNDVDDSPENDLALNMDHVFEADECDAFDSDVDEGPITQTMF